MSTCVYETSKGKLIAYKRVEKPYKNLLYT